MGTSGPRCTVAGSHDVQNLDVGELRVRHNDLARARLLEDPWQVLQRAEHRRLRRLELAGRG